MCWELKPVAGASLTLHHKLRNETPMQTPARIFILTLFAVIAFAGNSVLARFALGDELIGPWSFTLIRLLAGAVVLAVLVGPRTAFQAGSWYSAAALLVYAGFFSYAYLMLPTATGALILFAIVQLTMLGAGLAAGERLRVIQWAGTGLAIAGLLALLSPALAPPSWVGALLMALAGIGWGVYSLRGRTSTRPTAQTAGNFTKAAVIASLLAVPLLLWMPEVRPQTNGVLLALASGAITSGLGYAIWYMALPGLSANRAGVSQLSVPAIAALGGMVFLGEPITFGFIVASLVILGGVALATLTPSRSK